MYNQTSEDVSPLRLESLLADSVTRILEHEDPGRFFDWLGQHLHEYYTSQVPGLFPDPQDFIMMSMGLGRAIWNAMPLPGNNFRPRPLSDPGR